MEAALQKDDIRMSKSKLDKFFADIDYNQDVSVLLYSRSSTDCYRVILPGTNGGKIRFRSS